MTGIYIIGGLVLVGIAGYIYLKVRWGRAARKEAALRQSDIASDRAREIKYQENKNK